MIKRLLVANRGEIAVRILATAAVLDVPTVAVYPADDASCAHVAQADEAVLLPGTGAAAYLDAGAVVAAATATRCDAVHPGYGLLSESPVLAGRCAEAGLVFVGPDAKTLALFGDKTAARSRAREVGVPVLAGTPGGTSLEAARAFLREHGAVMVKAVAGGGGRGMRPVTREQDLAEAMRRCASEAAASFGDGSLYVERLLAPARHVEVQVIGDGTGAIAVLGDRDCSIQRRRQKLIEIAPAALDEHLRGRLAEAAVALVGSTPYAGLATVEFLVQDDVIAFLEVNPRLRPGGGVLSRFQPPSGHGIRVDTHGYSGYEVSLRYDSLLAKVVAVGGDLTEAARRAVRALADFDIAGVPTNVAVLQAILRAPGLGRLEVGWVDAHLAELAGPEGAEPARGGPEVQAVPAPLPGTVLSIAVSPGDRVAAGDDLMVLEAMKMEHEVRAERSGVVHAVTVRPGGTVEAGAIVLLLSESGDEGTDAAAGQAIPPEHIRADLAEVLERHRIGLDEGRPEVVERRHAGDHRTARENIADLVDPADTRRALIGVLARTPA